MLAEFLQMWDELLNTLIEGLLDQQSDDDSDWDFEPSLNKCDSEEIKYSDGDFEISPNEYDSDVNQSQESVIQILKQEQKTDDSNTSPIRQSVHLDKGKLNMHAWHIGMLNTSSVSFYLQTFRTFLYNF